MILGFKDEFRFLSNFFPVNIEYLGLRFKSTEAAYQASKTIDLKERAIISNLFAGQAKRYGSKVVIREDWESIKYQVMLDITRLKYNDHELRQLLLATGDREIFELNDWGDTYWGVIQPFGTELVGNNNLGKILMQVREEIK